MPGFNLILGFIVGISIAMGAYAEKADFEDIPTNKLSEMMNLQFNRAKSKMCDSYRYMRSIASEKDLVIEEKTVPLNKKLFNFDELIRNATSHFFTVAEAQQLDRERRNIIRQDFKAEVDDILMVDRMSKKSHAAESEKLKDKGLELEMKLAPEPDLYCKH